MRVGQDAIIEKKLSPQQVLNMDETGINKTNLPTYLYVPENAERAESYGTASKSRITAIITVNAHGEFLPTMFILKHSSTVSGKEIDNKVLNYLHKKQNFRAQEGWTLRKYDNDYKYLQNINGNIITSQINAWNDETRMLMYVDLILKPYMELNNFEESLLWMDNFSVHKKRISNSEIK